MYPDFRSEREKLTPLFPIRVRYLIPPKGPGEFDVDVVPVAMNFTRDMYGVQNAIAIVDREVEAGTFVSFYFKTLRDLENFNVFMDDLGEIK